MPLYKYLFPERMDVLQSGKIRFTQPTQLNDPFDTKPNITALTDDKWIEKFLVENFSDENIEKTAQESLEAEFEKNGLNKNHPMFNEALQLLKQATRTIAPGMLKEAFQLKMPGIKDALFNALDNTVGVLSLTEKPDNLLMWTHYADSHKGFVLEFNEKHEFFDQRRKPEELQGHIRKIHYQEDRPKILLYDSSLSDQENTNVWIEKFIWYKAMNWKYEEEWRMVYTFNDKKDTLEQKAGKVYLFPFPYDCITGVILGCKMSYENRNRLLQILSGDDKFRHIKIYEAVEDGKESIMNIQNLEKV